MRDKSERVICIFWNPKILLIFHPPSSQNPQFWAEFYILPWKTYLKPIVIHIQLRKYHFNIRNQKNFFGEIVHVVRQCTPSSPLFKNHNFSGTIRLTSDYSVNKSFSVIVLQKNKAKWSTARTAWKKKHTNLLTKWDKEQGTYCSPS